MHLEDEQDIQSNVKLKFEKQLKDIAKVRELFDKYDEELVQEITEDTKLSNTQSLHMSKMAKNYAAGMRHGHFYNELSDIDKEKINKNLPEWIERAN
jgi:hypothetical protein